MTIFHQPINQTVITTVRPDGSFSTITAPEVVFPNNTGRDFVALMIAAFIAIFILWSSNGSLEDSGNYYDEPSQHLERVAEAPYNFEEEEPDLDDDPDQEASLFRMLFPTSSSSEAASAAPAQRAKDSDKKAGSFHDGRIFTRSNRRRLTPEAIETELQKHPQLSPEEFLFRAKNEIFAAAGYNFEHNPEIYEYYMRFDWYQDLEKSAHVRLSKAARANLDLFEDFA